MIGIKTIALVLVVGICIGMVISAKLKIGSTEISNNIRKIKTDEGAVMVDQTIPPEIKTEPKKRPIKRFIQSIFSRKNK